jgi:hypothetical protein
LRTVRRTIPTPARCSEWDIATPLNPAHQARATVVEVVVYSVTVVPGSAAVKVAMPDCSALVEPVGPGLMGPMACLAAQVAPAALAERSRVMVVPVVKEVLVD